MAGGVDDLARDVILRLLAARAPGATICPSEAARALAAAAGDDAWRGRMMDVHAAVDQLMDRNGVILRWKGATMSARTGPYRIALVVDPPDAAVSIG